LDNIETIPLVEDDIRFVSSMYPTVEMLTGSMLGSVLIEYGVGLLELSIVNKGSIQCRT